MMHLYLFAPIPYHFLHQRPQKIADQFRARSIAVTYVEPNGFREYLTGQRKGFFASILVSFGYHLLALLSFLFPAFERKPSRKGRGGRTPEKNEIILLPLVIPTNRINAPVLERLNAAVLRQAVRRRIFRTMDPAEESIAFVENPFYGQVLRPGDFSKVFYDCLDDLSLYAGLNSPRRYQAYEAKLVGMSNALFVTAEKLEERLRSIPHHPPIYRVPNGVDDEWFRRQAVASEVPSDLREIAQPVVGYVGAIYNWLDYDLIAMLARELPDVSFVFVGPIDSAGRTDPVRNLPNLHFLGRKPYELIPSCINQFAVCLIPFAPGTLSQTTNPVKVFEYFALGKPVVSTPLFELNQYRDRDLLLMPESRDGFVAAVREALRDTDERRRSLRMEVARENSWQNHVSKMSNVLCQ